MKMFTASCVCGSRLEIRDDAESFINPQTNEPDSKGRQYLIEVRADEWLDRHDQCVKARVKGMTNGKK